MFNQDILQSIVDAGAQAPSGGNSQPWEVSIRGNTIYLHSLPQKDHPVLNFRHRGTLISHGAWIENARIAAKKSGFGLRIDVPPKNRDGSVIAELTITDTDKSVSANGAGSSLYEAIYNRSTNRRPYDQKPVTKEALVALREAAELVGKARAFFVDDPRSIDEISSAASVNEATMLGNQWLHGYFTKEIAWSREEERQRNGGLYIRTLELNPVQRFMVRIFKSWPILRFANAILHINEKIAAENAATYKKSSMMCIITAPAHDREYINAGMLMERIWLTATKLSISVQPLAGILYLYQRVSSEQVEQLTESEQAKILSAYDIIYKAAKRPNDPIAMILRMGYAEPPSSRSYKYSTDVKSLSS